MMKGLAIMATVLLVLTGCGRDYSEIHDTVIRYNMLLADGYRNLNMNQLAQVATESRATKAYHHMAAVGEGGLKMDATLKNIEFGQVKELGSDKVEIASQEMWEYVYLDIKSGEPLFDNAVSYQLIYQLEKNQGNWLISDIKIEKSEEQKDSQFIFQRPADTKVEVKGTDNGQKLVE